jgi:ankyrin repeat protein
MYRSPDDPAVHALTAAIQAGALDELARILDADPELASGLVGDERQARGALHVATDFPGHFPNTAAVIALLVERGADVDARFVGPHRETPLHWAASTDDVEAIEALVAAGADIEADGAVLTGGSPLDDAVVFGQWNAARRLYELGAQTKLFHAAALDLPDRVQELLAETPDADTVTGSLWHACHAGSVATAELLIRAGGDPDWLGWDDLTPLDVARREGHDDVVAAIARLR